LVWTKTAAGYTATGETGRFYSIVRHNGQFRLAGGGGHADQTLGTLKFLKAKCDEIEYAVVTDARTEADEQAREDRAKALKAFGGQYKTPANTTAEEDAVKAERKPSVLSKLVKPVAEPTAPHLIVKARAGTGKTTTLVGALEVLWGRTPRTAKGDPIVPSPQQRAVWDAVALSKGAKKVAFVAFNVSIKDELQRRVPPGCEAMTSHGLGNRALRSAFGNLRLDKGRVDTILEEMLEKDVWTLRRQHGPMVTAVKELVSMCKANLKEGTPDELDELVAHYEIELDGTKAQVYDLVPQVLDRCKEFGRDRAMDFDDMVWGPVALDLPMPKYDLLMVDEAQDLNRAQQALVRKAAKRLVLCGDDRQAIYGFAGADSDSLPRMEAELGATGQGCEVLPLTVTRRCGKRIVAEAAAIVPDFEAHESNGEGLVRRSVWDGESKACYRNEARDGDMLLCRVNAPLVQECFWFLKNGRKASIQGRNVGEGLIRLVRKVTDDDDTTPATRLVELLGRWLDEETRKEQAKKNPDDDRLINLGDRHDCIVVFTEGAGTAGDVVRKIEEVFTDDKAKPGIRLSSIHRAKGLEARRVFLLEPERATVPHPMAKTAWQVGQEFNLRYVAITRAIEELVYVS